MGMPKPPHCILHSTRFQAPGNIYPMPLVSSAEDQSTHGAFFGLLCLVLCIVVLCYITTYGMATR